MRANVITALYLTGALLLAGCAAITSPGAEKRQRALEEATETYRKMMRWGYYEEAALYLRAKGEETLPKPEIERLKQYKIAGWEQGERMVNDSGDEARMVVRIQYYEVDSGVTRAVRDEQRWWYEETERRWFLGSPMPQFWKR